MARTEEGKLAVQDTIKIALLKNESVDWAMPSSGGKNKELRGRLEECRKLALLNYDFGPETRVKGRRKKAIVAEAEC